MIIRYGYFTVDFYIGWEVVFEDGYLVCLILFDKVFKFFVSCIFWKSYVIFNMRSLEFIIIF